MPALWKDVAAILMLTAAAAIGGCGASEQDEGGRAQYAVQANLFCESLRTELVPIPRPLTHRRLWRYLARADRAMRAAAAGLHDARRRLGDTASAQVRAFDGRVDGVADVTRRLADESKRGLHPTPAGQRALISRADATREAFAGLRRLATAARLRRCGLGGEDLADTVLFTTYRGQYLRIQDATFASLRLTPFRRSDSLPRYLRESGRYLKVRKVEYRRVRRLTPTADLRAAHDAVVKRFAEAIRADGQLQTALYRSSLRSITFSAARLQRKDDDYFAAVGRLRRLLDSRAPP